MKRLTVLLMLALIASVSLTACNTVQGFGKDVKKVGEKMEQASK